MMRLLIFAFFVSVPLLMTEELRLNLGAISLPAALLVVLAAGLVLFATNPRQFLRMDKGSGRIFAFAGVLLLVHLIGLIRANDVALALKYTVKLAAGLGMAHMIFLTLRNHRPIRERFAFYLSAMLIASAVVLAYYAGQNLLHGNAYLTTHIDTGRGVGKNQIQVYLALIAPIAWYRFRTAPNVLWAAVFGIHAFSCVYVGSRGLWVALVLAVLVSVLVSGRIPTRLSYKRLAGSVRVAGLGLIAVVLLALAAINLGGNLSSKFGSGLDYLEERAASLTSDETDLRTSGSVYERKYYVRYGTKLFLSQPVLGSGLGNFEKSNRYHKLSHNDYIFLLADLGTLGLLAFLVFAISILIVFYHHGIPLYFLLVFFIDLLFINAYSFPVFWIVLAIALAYKNDWATLFNRQPARNLATA